MQLSQQENHQEKHINSIPIVFLNAFELIDEKKVNKLNNIETPLMLIEYIEDFKENTFWMKIRDIWVLIGKIPPLKLEFGDVVFFKENERWGLFKYLEEKENVVFLRDAKDERNTKVSKEVIDSLELFGKVLRVQKSV